MFFLSSCLQYFMTEVLLGVLRALWRYRFLKYVTYLYLYIKHIGKCVNSMCWVLWEKECQAELSWSFGLLSQSLNSVKKYFEIPNLNFWQNNDTFWLTDGFFFCFFPPVVETSLHMFWMRSNNAKINWFWSWQAHWNFRHPFFFK